ncbi:MAG: porin family protein [Gracilimonas sp.]
MKFYLITIITITLMALGSANAQNINIGVKGGLNSYSMESNNNIEFDSKIGLNFGLLGHTHLNEYFALQPEIVYSMQGAKSGNTNVKLSYINVPILVQYMFDNGFRIQTGPQLGFMMNAEIENNNSTINIEENYKSIDLGLSVGASYVHTPTGFGIDARYNHGISDISESSNNKSYNRGFEIGIFYLFSHN